MKRRPIRTAIESIKRALDPKVSAVTTLADTDEETAAREKIAAKEAHIDLHKRAFENAWGRPMGERELAKLHGQIKAQEDMNDVGPMLDRISPRTGDYRGQVDQLNRAAVDLQRAANAGFKQT
jgi:hypothetical protein